MNKRWRINSRLRALRATTSAFADAQIAPSRLLGQVEPACAGFVAAGPQARF